MASFPFGLECRRKFASSGDAINSSFIPPPLVLTVSTCYMVVGGSLSYLQVPGESPGYFYPFHQESPLAKELSIFVDESGDRGGKANGTHGARHLLRHG